ncbi:MAG: aldo/keto reductase, partial [Rhodospirillales bacterium]|nr:aldo/keto reductase [Rhodospirillales bacterium]
MRTARLGKSGIIVSRLGIGTMSIGSQLDEAASHRILDAAHDAGVSLVDTAEMYPSPPSPETYGRSEEIVGSWLRTKPRDSVVLATKVVGPSDGDVTSGRHVRGGLASLDLHHIERAAEASLRRLHVDCIDVFLTHWPDRRVPLEVQAEAMGRLVEAGKIRSFGLSNETAWGVTRFCALADFKGTPRPATTQNLLNLLQRTAETSALDACRHEGIGFIAFSPMAMGALTGKYSSGRFPPGARLALFERYRLAYGGEALLRRADAYVALAREFGMEPSVLAVAWVLSRPGVSCVLSTANDAEQLKRLLEASQAALAP